jgi:polyphosphate kinase 2 (PPK2 family)
MLIEDGIMLRKYWFSVSDKEQEARFRSRAADPMKRWKLSPMDPESLLRWEEYSLAKDEMMAHTDVEMSPWWVVESEDKKTARINVISHLLARSPTRGRPARSSNPQAARAHGGERPPKSTQRFVPDVAGELKR